MDFIGGELFRREPVDIVSVGDNGMFPESKSVFSDRVAFQKTIHRHVPGFDGAVPQQPGIEIDLRGRHGQQMQAVAPASQYDEEFVFGGGRQAVIVKQQDRADRESLSKHHFQSICFPTRCNRRFSSCRRQAVRRNLFPPR